MTAPVRRWVEITLRGPLASKDEAIALLIRAGSGAVVESNRSAGQTAENTQVQTLTASLAEEEVERGANTLSTLGESFKAMGWDMSLAVIKDRDWSVAWRAGVKPVRLRYRGQGLLVRTSWSKAQKKPGEAEVIIDPSMAFGTGTHPTTRMCLKALLMLHVIRGEAFAEDRLLDLGTGSGILLIAALKLGLTRGLGLEIDPLALKVARSNLKRNNVKASLSGAPPGRVRGKFSIITANVFSEELRRLGPELLGLLELASHKDRGFIVLSGILRGQAPAVVATYRALGMRVYKKFVSGEWICIILQRPGR